MRTHCLLLMALLAAGCGQDGTAGGEDLSGGGGGADLRFASDGGAPADLSGGSADLATPPADAAAADDLSMPLGDGPIADDLPIPVDLPMGLQDVGITQDLTGVKPPLDLSGVDQTKLPPADLAGADLTARDMVVVKPPPDLAGADLNRGGGCASNKDCIKTDYCQFPPNMCGPMGVCMPRPQICNQIFDPVCGCDGVNYGNSCQAAAAGQSYAHKGMCP